MLLFVAFDYENRYGKSETITSILNLFVNENIELNNNHSKESDDINHDINDDNETLCSDLSDRDLTLHH